MLFAANFAIDLFKLYNLLPPLRIFFKHLDKCVCGVTENMCVYWPKMCPQPKDTVFFHRGVNKPEHEKCGSRFQMTQNDSSITKQAGDLCNSRIAAPSKMTKKCNNLPDSSKPTSVGYHDALRNMQASLIKPLCDVTAGCQYDPAEQRVISPPLSSRMI